MFSECYKLKEIKGINNFNTNQVTNMKAMFNKCNKLEYLDLSNFDTSNVTDMGYMFYGCNNLKCLNLLNFKLKDNCYTENIFEFKKGFSGSPQSFLNKCKFITNNDILKNLYS